MKRRISDLLDGIPGEPVELKTKTPLSSQRIKELTMSKITKNEKKGNRAVFRILAVAAAISLMTVTAFAAEKVFGVGDLFRNIFNDQQEKDRQMVQENGLDVNVQETISQGQIDVVNELGRNFQPVTQSSEGTTVTLKAAYADANILKAYLSVEAPEGTVLPDGIIYQFADRNNSPDWMPVTVGSDAPYDVYGIYCETETLPDEDPDDNKKEFCVTVTTQGGGEFAFNDGYSKFLNIDGIYQQVLDVDGDEDGFDLLAPGSFSFDVGTVNGIMTIDVDVNGLTYGGHKTRTWTHDSPCLESCGENLTGETDPETGLPMHSESWDYSVTAKSLKITPLSAEYENEYTTSNERRSFSLAFQVVMKDGTSPVCEYRTVEYADDGRSAGIAYFTTPIDFSEIDYILIGDPEIDSTYKVYLPQ